MPRKTNSFVWRTVEQNDYCYSEWFFSATFQEAKYDLQADYETIGSVIPVYFDFLNKVSLTREHEYGTNINNKKRPLAGKLSRCADLVGALKKSLQSARMWFVLQDT